MITAQEIHGKLEAAFPGAQLRVVDTTGTFDHFDVIVVSPRFEGLARVAQHQAVYDALGDDMRERIHALALKTFTPQRWAEAGH